jgi:hypothetical protein
LDDSTIIQPCPLNYQHLAGLYGCAAVWVEKGAGVGTRVPLAVGDAHAGWLFWIAKASKVYDMQWLGWWSGNKEGKIKIP